MLYPFRSLPAGTALLIVLLALLAAPNNPTSARAEPSIIIDGCKDLTIAASDDGSSEPIDLPFDLEFGDRAFSRIWVNNNGSVTFDGPLADYTPWGLETTSRVIIAPYFADVDTRGQGSKIVTAGMTTFEGRPAYCVNWLRVGYFEQHADRTNSFQLVIVDRSDIASGSFDIVMNYDRLLWESGDTSGGVEGRGGTGPAVGFSNGDGEYFQMPGSLQSGTFINAGTFPLASNSNAEAPGRYRWRMRDGEAPTDYAAMGDSFQSGEGAYHYLSGTDTTTNRCHRSARAYPRLIFTEGGDRDLRFVACSGARLREIEHPFADADKQGERSQVDALGQDTGLVTIGIVGNDLQFGKTIDACVKANAGALNPISWTASSCENTMGEASRALLDSLANGRLRTQLANVYREVRLQAPRAKILVVTYPQFYRPVNFYERLGWCSGVRGSDQEWINAGIADANNTIADLAASFGFTVADMTDVFSEAGHGLCSGDEAMNGLLLQDGEDNHRPGRGSYHPNALGHELMAARIRSVLPTPFAPTPAGFSDHAPRTLVAGTGQTDTISLNPGASEVREFRVEGAEFSVNTAWQDGPVSLELRSPNGTVFDVGSPQDADHMGGLTVERFAVPNPEHGTWAVTVRGDQAFDSPVEVDLSTYDRPTPNQRPVAAATIAVDATGNVVLDGAASADPEGGELSHYWDFGDGTGATGQTVSHRYPAGTHVPTLMVRDDAGGEGFQTVRAMVKQSKGAASPTLTFVDGRGKPVPPVPPRPTPSPSPSQSPRPVPQPTVSDPPTPKPAATGTSPARNRTARASVVQKLRVRVKKHGRVLVSWRALPGVRSYKVRVLRGKGVRARASRWRKAVRASVIVPKLKRGVRYRVQVKPAVKGGRPATVAFVYRRRR